MLSPSEPIRRPAYCNHDATGTICNACADPITCFLRELDRVEVAGRASDFFCAPERAFWIGAPPRRADTAPAVAGSSSRRASSPAAGAVLSPEEWQAGPFFVDPASDAIQRRTPYRISIPFFLAGCLATVLIGAVLGALLFTLAL